jgi:uridine kinase
VYVELDDDTRFIRRMMRDLNERGRSIESIVTHYQNTVKPMFYKFVKPSKRHAHVIIPNDDKHDIGVDLIASKIKSVLLES